MKRSVALATDKFAQYREIAIYEDPLIEGCVSEDVSPRYLYHFYDPDTGLGSEASVRRDFNAMYTAWPEGKHVRFGGTTGSLTSTRKGQIVYRSGRSTEPIKDAWISNEPGRDAKEAAGLARLRRGIERNRAFERRWIDREAAAAEGVATKIEGVSAGDAAKVRELVGRWRADWRKFVGTR